MSWVPARAKRLPERLERSMAVLRAPRETIDLYGGIEAQTCYRTFTARHPQFRITSSKRWGVALLRLSDTFEEYLAGGSKEYLRRQRRRAQKAGYRYAVVSPADHIEEIVEINRSKPIRQGRVMPASYVDRELVTQRLGDRAPLHGILDADGRLRAYVYAPLIGDVFEFSLILGHADDLDRGVMYLLVSEVIRGYVDVRRTEGRPAWAMYDTVWGASSGLAYFKARLGFRPYTVDWRWLETPGAPVPPEAAASTATRGDGARDG
jgi:hypothetical protein